MYPPPPPFIQPSRPIGVAILAVLQIISGVVEILIGIVLFLGFVLISAFDGGLFATAFLLMALIAFAFGAFSFVMAYGLWAGKKWAWTLSVIGAVVGVVLGVIGLILGGLVLENMTNVVLIVLDVVIVVYLSTRNVRAFFGKPGGLVFARPIMPPPTGQPYPPPIQPMYPPPPPPQPYSPQPAPYPQPGPYPQPQPYGPTACPTCGHPAQPRATFCDRCGTRLR